MSFKTPLRSFRMVCEPGQKAAVKELLAAQGFFFEDEPFSPFCKQLKTEPFPLGSSLAAYFGYIYIQDRSSMLPPLALAPASAAFCLDMCASPGSKTSFLAQLCGANGLVLANETNRERLATLRANLERMNIFNAGLSAYDGRDLPLLPNSAPNILLDPPCSGWGTASKNPAAPKIWHDEKIIPLIRLQKRLLAKAANLAADGGHIVYSTCTTNSAENEDVINYAIENLPLVIVPLKPFPGFVFKEKPLERGLLLVDGTASGSHGFFIALLKKTAKNQAETEQFPMFKPLQTIQLDMPLPAAGEAAIFGKHARFIPQLAESFLPQRLRWQAPVLGEWHDAAGFKPKKSLRYPGLLQDKNLPQIVFEKIEELQKFLSGAGFSVSAASKNALLCWRELPLGIAAVKNGRVINSFCNKN